MADLTDLLGQLNREKVGYVIVGGYAAILHGGTVVTENWRGLKNLYLQTDWGAVDCLSEVLGVGDYTAVRKQSILVKLPFGKCRVLGLDALIKAKEAMGRTHDRQSVVQNKAIRARAK